MCSKRYTPPRAHVAGPHLLLAAARGVQAPRGGAPTSLRRREYSKEWGDSRVAGRDVSRARCPQFLLQQWQQGSGWMHIWQRAGLAQQAVQAASLTCG